MKAGPPRELLQSLTPIRGVAAIILATIHFMLIFVPEQAKHFAHLRPYLLLDVFFMMSGLVMAHVYGSSLAESPRGTAMGFLRARFARMVPLHLVTLAVVVIMVTVWHIHEPEIDFSTDSLLLNIMMLQGLPAQLSWNFPSWSVGDEMLAYGLFVFTARPLIRGRYGWWFAAGCVLALEVSARKHGGVQLSGGVPGLIRAIAGFTLGVLTYRAWRLDKRRLHRICKWLVVPALLVGAALRDETLLIVDLLMLIVLALELEGRATALLNARPLELIGEWSYSVYLWHVPILFAVTSWMSANAIVPARLNCWPAVAIIVVLVSITLLVAAISYRWLEQPARQMLRVRRRRMSIANSL